MSKHSHEWLTQYFAFPDEDGVYEMDEPYEVQYCSDRECGERRILSLDEDLAASVREFNQLPPEDIQTEDDKGGE